MKKTAKIDRATLLKGGGTAALATLLVGSLNGSAQACCDPIDLTYSDDPMPSSATRFAKARRSATTIKAIRLWSPGGTPYPDTSWTLKFDIPSAHASGRDEDRRGHGQSGEPAPPRSLGYTIYVFTK